MDHRIRGAAVTGRVLLGLAVALLLVCWPGSDGARAQVVCSPGQGTVGPNGTALAITCFGIGAQANQLMTRIPGTTAICTFIGFSAVTGCAQTSLITRVQLRDEANPPGPVVRDRFTVTISRLAWRRMRDQLNKNPVLFFFVQCYLIAANPFCANVNLHLGGGSVGPLAILKLLIYAKYPGDNEKYRRVRTGFSAARTECRFYAQARVTGEGTLKGRWEVYPPTAFPLEVEDLRIANTPQDEALIRRGAFFGDYVLRLNGGNRTITIPGPHCSEIVKLSGPGKSNVLFRPTIRRQASALSGGPNVVGGQVSLAIGPGAGFLIDPAELVHAISFTDDAERRFSAELRFDGGGRPVVHWTALEDRTLVVRVDITNADGGTVSEIAPAPDGRLTLQKYKPGATLGISVIGSDGREIVIPRTSVSPGQR